MSNDEVRIPDVEVLIGAAGYDVAVFCFYKREDVHQGYDVVCALPASNESAVVKQILQDAITALNTANWYTLDELDPPDADREEEPPF